MITLNHKKLDVFQTSTDLVSEICQLTELFPKSENFGLISRLRRASVSIPSNIAEGSARSSDAERRRFLQIARSSLVEVDTQIEIALKLRYISKDDIDKLSEFPNKVFAMLSSMMK